MARASPRSSGWVSNARARWKWIRGFPFLLLRATRDGWRWTCRDPRSMRASCGNSRSRVTAISHRDAMSPHWMHASVLVRSLHPDERLQVDHVAWPEVASVAPDVFREFEQRGIDRPAGPRRIGQIEAIGFCSPAGHDGFEEDVLLGLRYEREHRDQRPGQHARLAPRQSRDHLHPSIEAPCQRRATMQQVEQSFREGAGARGSAYGITQGHFLEGEDHAVARTLFHAHGTCRDLAELAGTQQTLEFGPAQRLVPALVRLHLVFTFQADVVGVTKTLGKIAEELPAATLDEGRSGWLVHDRDFAP